MELHRPRPESGRAPVTGKGWGMSGTFRKPEDSAGRDADAKRPRPASLPCLKKNNSTEIPYLDCLSPDEQARLKALVAIENLPVRKLPDGCFLQTFEDGTEVILGGMSRSELKTAFVLEQNVAKLFRD